MTNTLEKRLSGLSPEQIKALVNKRKKPAKNAKTAVKRENRYPGQDYPLSSAEERLWFLSRLAPDTKAFNNPGAIRAQTDTPLEREYVERALQQVGLRHEILRTSYHSHHGKAVRRLHDAPRVESHWQDIRHLPEAEKEQRATDIAIAEGRRHFDLASGPLLVLTVVHIREGDYMLLNTSHHIISDGWSQVIFSTELTSAYDRLKSDTAVEPPPPAFQYSDYVDWEQRWLNSEHYRKLLSYWTDQLANLPPAPVLPTDAPRPARLSYQGASMEYPLPTSLAQGLRSFAKQHRFSVFQLLIAALSLLLYRYSGQRDILLGTSVANRNKSEFQQVMGLLLNTLVIRSQVDGKQCLNDYLSQMRGVCQQALTHQEMPFEKLVTELNLPRHLNSHPIFQVMLVYQNVPAQYEVPGMCCTPCKVDYQTAKFDINLWVDEQDDELKLTLYYDSALFQPSTVKRFLSHYHAMLENIVQRPHTEIDQLPYMPASELDFVLSRQTPTHSVLSDEISFQQRFEKQALIAPNNIAVDDLDRRFSYGELNAEANRLAHYLRRQLSAEQPSSKQQPPKQGSQHDTERPIALLVNRDRRMILAMMGILKSGAAYLPLDAAMPAERLAMIIEDANPIGIITEQKFATTASTLGIKVIDLDRDQRAIKEESDRNLEPSTRPEQMAYLIYTSGTSGTPKGVCVEQRNLLNYCDAIWPTMNASSNDRFATVSSMAADLGNTMIFPPLANGACVVVVSDALITDADRLAQSFTRQPIDYLKIVPAHLHALLSGAHPDNVLPRKCLIVGGDRCPATLIQKVHSLSPNLRIINHYGPSEVTIGALTHEVIPSAQYQESIPIGRPLPGCQVYVLDQQRCPKPPGVCGEIYLGGAQVARGYLNPTSPDQNRFIANPFKAGERLYQTGDRGKVLADGNIVFSGRMDRQFKVRGYRVEPIDIEQTLIRQPNIEQAAVLAPSEDQQQLIAYVQVAKDATIDSDSIKQQLRLQLPSYMIPHAIITRTTLPITANGKIDFKALAKSNVVALGKSEHTPRDPVELALMLIWQDLLNSHHFGIDDNFFEIGGHSLLAVELVARVNSRFEQSLPLSCLFEYGTIKQLAGRIQTEQAPLPESPLVEIQAKGEKTPLYFIHPAGGNVLCYYTLAQELADLHPFFGLQARFDSSASKRNLNNTLTDMAQVYLDKITTSTSGQPTLIGGWSMGALVAFEVAQLCQKSGQNLPVIAILDQAAPEVETSQSGSQDEADRLAFFAAKVSLLVGQDLGLLADTLRNTSPLAQAALFLEKFKAHALAPEHTRPEEFQGFLQMMLHHNQMSENYRPDVYEGKIVVFRAEQALQIDPQSAINASAHQHRPQDLGWQRYSAQPVEVISVPGNHVTMMTTPHVQTLAQRLKRYLKENP